MASVFKRAGGRKWSIKYKKDGAWVTVKGYTDKALTLKKAAMLEHEQELGQRGVVVFTAPKKEQLASYERHLRDKGDSAEHVNRTMDRLAFVLANVKEIAELTRPDVCDRLQSPKGSSRTKNHYLGAVKGFVRWLIDNRRLQFSPVTQLRKQTEVTDRERRCPTVLEINRILNTKGATHGLTAEQRNWLYRAAINTGLRAGELATLTPENFSFEGPAGSVRVRASISKNKKESVLPLQADFSKPFKKWLATLPPDQPIWPGHWSERAAEMLRFDLGKIPYKTTEGVFDFHAFRVFYVTFLIRSGANAKTVQTLARHSTPTLTLSIYAKMGVNDGQQAVNGLPKTSPPAHQTGVKTGPNRSKRVQAKTD